MLTQIIFKKMHFKNKTFMRKVALFYITAKIFDTELNRRQLNSPICSIYNLYMCEMSHIM